MATYLWNDIEYKSYNPTEWDADKRNGYVIFRKIYVQALDEHKLKETNLRKHFEKYGTIDDVKMSNPNDPTNLRHFAYITYRENISAYEAASRYSKSCSTAKYIVRPADTWHQTLYDDQVDETDTTANLLELNDDSLLDIFERCDIETLSNLYDVCERLRTLVQREGKSRHLQRIKLKIPPNASLRKTRQLLRFVGNSVEDLYLEFNFYRKPKNLERYLHKIVQYVHGRIKRVKIASLDLSNEILVGLKPLLERIQVFKLNSQQYDFDYDIDFRPFMPDVLKFQMHQNMRFIGSSGPWKKLENLSLHQNQYLESITVEQLLKNNRQLKTLSITLDDMDQNFKGIAHYSTNLRKLTIKNGYPPTSGERVILFQNLPLLQILHLTEMEYELFSGVLDTVSKLNRLTQLKLHVYNDINEIEVDLTDGQIDTICNKLVNLNVLHLGNVGFVNRQAIDLVQRMPNLKELGLKFDEKIPITLQERLNDARREVNGINDCKALTIIVNPFEVTGPRNASLIAAQPCIQFKKLCSIDPYLQFEVC